MPTETKIHGAPFLIRIGANRFPNKLVNWTLVIFITSIVFAMFIRASRFNDYSRVYVLDMINGRAYKPFVYRALLPTTVRLVAIAIPESTRIAYNQWLLDYPQVKQAANRMGWEKDHLSEYTALVVLMYLSLLGFALSARYLFSALFKAPSGFVNLVPLVVLLGLPPIFSAGTYIYDFPSLFLFTLGLGLMAKKKWGLFFLIYLLGCLNKETIILLTLVFSIYFYNPKRMERAQYLKFLLYQLVIFAAVKISLTLIFINNPGSFVETHFWDHNIAELLSLLKPYPLSVLILGGIMLFLVFFHWREQPQFLRDSFLIVIPLLGLTLFLGYIEELRDYYEVYPIIALLVLNNIGKIIGVEIQNVVP